MSILLPRTTPTEALRRSVFGAKGSAGTVRTSPLWKKPIRDIYFRLGVLAKRNQNLRTSIRSLRLVRVKNDKESKVSSGNQRADTPNCARTLRVVRVDRSNDRHSYCIWCGRPDLNRHGKLLPRDFKSNIGYQIILIHHGNFPNDLRLCKKLCKKCL